MRKLYIITGVFFCFIAFLLVSAGLRDNRNELNIHYTLNYGADTWEKNRTGLLWTLSYLGAELPKNCFDTNIKWLNKKTFCINFKKLGFSEKAVSALKIICDSIKETPVYKKTNSVDLGHFIALTLGSSWHYYQITDVPRTYGEFVTLHNFSSYEIFPITRSTVSEHHRILKINLKDSILNSVFVAEEGEGQVDKGSFNAVEFEAMDIMKNGQLRFMVYDRHGALLAAGNKSFGESGKPAKCIWCHEINIQPLFRATDTIKGFMSPHEFLQKIKNQNKLLNDYRATLNSEINFKNLQDHTYQELIYIGFMEPSVKKLSQEWNIPVEKLNMLLQNKAKHVHHEFKFLGELMHRDEVKNSSIYRPGSLPASIREENESEPDYFK